MCTHTLDDGRYHRKEEGKTRMRSDVVTMWVVGTIGETEPSKENPIGHNLRHWLPQFEALATTI